MKTIADSFRSLLVVDVFPKDQLGAFERLRFGGIVVRRRFTDSPEQVAELIRLHQRRARCRLLVAANFEWGVANDVRGCRSLFPGAMALGAACPGSDLGLASQQARAIAREAVALGVNTIFGPVLDPVPAKRASDSGTRSFSDDPRRLSAYAAAYIRGLQAGGLSAVAKHFPGGHAATDAHLDRAAVNMTLRQLQQRSLPPFVSAVEADVAGIMMQHNAYPRVAGDELPATLSPGVYDLLRRRLGFDGFIITDNMSMGAIAKHFAPEEALLGPLRAGADLVLVRSTAATPQLLAKCERIIAREPELQQRILQAASRVETHRVRWARPRPHADYRRAEARSIALAGRIAAEAVAVIRDPQHLLPVTPARYRRVLLVCPQAREGFHVALPSNFGRLTLALKAGLPDAEMMFISDDPAAAERQLVVKRAAAAELVVLEIHEEPGVHGLPAGQIALCRQMMKAADRRLIIAGLTAPLFLKSLPAKGAAVFAYSAMPASQEALASAILGQSPCRRARPE